MSNNIFNIYTKKALVVLNFLFLTTYNYCQNQDNNSLKDFIETSSALKTAIVGVSFIDISTGAKVFEFNENKSLIPASVHKLVTSIIAINNLGYEYKFKTAVGYSGKIKNDTLYGDLIIKGGGDPSFGSKYFNPDYNLIFSKMLDSIKFKVITGKIICDASHFNDNFIIPSWTWQDMGNYYGAGIYGLSFIDNTYTIEFNTSLPVGETPILLSINPEIENFEIDNKVKIDVSGTGDNSYIYGNYYTKKYSISGWLPQSNKVVEVRGSIPEPPLLFLQLLKKYLNEHSIQVIKGNDVCYNPVDMTDSLLTIESPILQELLVKMNQKSLNHYAEHILKECMIKTNFNNKISDFFSGQLSIMNIDDKGIQLLDGSGLSRYNLATADFMTELLYLFSKTDRFTDFRSTLSVSGISGTLKSYGAKTALSGNIYGKSGTMDRVKNISGYLVAKSGKMYAFTLFINGYDCSGSEIKLFIERFLLNFYNLN